MTQNIHSLTKSCDYVFIGAGPSTLAAVNTLSKIGIENVLILDSGSTLTKRGCPGLRAKTCTSCFGEECRVTSGIGGASAGFGNKLCHFPASNGILALVPEHFRSEVLNRMENLVGAAELTSSSTANVLPLKGTAYRKMYDAEIIPKAAYQQMLSRLICSIGPNVSVRDNTTVIDINVDEKGQFDLQLNDSSFVTTPNLIIGTGRAGHRFLRPMLKKLGVAYHENSPDIGFRFEADTGLFSDGFFYQNDPKYKFTHGSLGTSRTFCTCKGGTIVPVKYGQGFFADGAFLDQPTNVTNLALMVRDNKGLSDSEIDEWCSSVNRKSQGYLLVSEIDLSGHSEHDLVDAVLNRMPWPTDAHKALMAELLENIVLGRHVKMFDPSRGIDRKVRIYAPSVDHYWPSPALNQGSRTSISGLSIIGDANGVSRGIVQAIASGVGWAVLERYKDANGLEAAES